MPNEMSGRRRTQIVALAILVASNAALVTKGRAQEVAPGYTAHQTTAMITVDGVLDEAIWSEAEEIPLRWEYLPGNNVAPPVETVCHVAYDVGSLYLACRSTDPDPSGIRGHLAERDDRARLAQDDHIAFLIDTFNDERRGFQFRVNAAGVQWDAIHVKTEGFEDFSWDALWTSAVQITATGYNVEVAIPFGSLRFPSTADVQTWGFVIERSYPRGVRYRMRSVPTDRNTTCLLCGANKIVGFQGISPGGVLDLVPALTARRTDERPSFPDGDLVPTKQTDFADLQPDFGMDLRWGVTPSTSLNATFNPDFSHVEADQAQLSVNRRFALLFPEQRPFFLEGADFFLTPFQAVFTRTVVDPDAGVKVTGKEGANTVGVFAARDATTSILIPSNQGSANDVLAQESYAAVARYRRDLGPTSYVGGLMTSRSGGDYHNRVFGVDGVYQLNPSNGVRFQYLTSSTEYPNALALAHEQATGGFSGGAFTAQYNHVSQDWAIAAEYEDLSEDFRADLGFIPRVDLRSGRGSLSRIFRGAADGWFTQIAMTGAYSRIEDQGGNLSDETSTGTLTYRGPSQSNASLGASHVNRFHEGTIYGLDRADLSFDVRPSGSVSLGAGLRFGDFVDFRNNRESFGLSFTPNAQFDVGTRLAINLGQVFQRLTFGGQEVFQANLMQARVLFHFNTQTFVRGVVQYRKVSRDPDLYVSPVSSETEQLLTQLVFSYRVSAQTSLYVGYRDQHNGADDFDLLRRSRSLFIKFGYAFYP